MGRTSESDVHHFRCLCAEDLPLKCHHTFQNTMYKAEHVGWIREFGYLFYLSLFCHCNKYSVIFRLARPSSLQGNLCQYSRLLDGHLIPRYFEHEANMRPTQQQ
jgi:hypothetical protein